MNLEPRLASKIDFTGACWLWRASTTPGGYGTYDGKTAHRAVYERLVGVIPAGHDLHHTCGSRGCVNPSHVVPALPKDHRGLLERGRTHCPRGHAYDEANTHTTKRGKRRCRACDREQHRRQPVQHAERTCEGCEITFTPRRLDQRFCTSACRSKTWRRR